jgi:hypothetical protein
MVKYQSVQQLKIEEFKTPFLKSLLPDNCWVKLSKIVPWDKFATIYMSVMIIMYNAEDFLIDTIIEANNLTYDPLSRMCSIRMIKYQAEDMLFKMRFHDLFHENKFYRDGSNDASRNGQEFIKISKMINEGQFCSKNKNDIVKDGGELINRCYQFVARKHSLEI